MTDLAKHIVCALVDSPEEVRVSIEEKDHSATVRISVAPDDMGKVIGKKGVIANAIRTVMKAVGARNHQKIYVEIED